MKKRRKQDEQNLAGKRSKFEIHRECSLINTLSLALRALFVACFRVSVFKIETC